MNKLNILLKIIDLLNRAKYYNLKSLVTAITNSLINLQFFW